MDSYLGARRELDRERANEQGGWVERRRERPHSPPKEGLTGNYNFNIIASRILQAPALALAQAREPAVGS